MSQDRTPVAFSYVRFSTREQRKGDSLKRQEQAAAEWCQRSGTRLDTSVTLRDLGRSAYLGEHRTNPDRYALAAFLKMVETGKVPRGSFLVVEALDRLTREHIQPALLLILNLLQSGVRIVQLKPSEMVYDDKSEAHAIMLMIVELMRGNSESRMKSERNGSAWQAKKEAARAGKPQPILRNSTVGGTEVMTHLLPHWIEEKNGKLRLIPERAKVMRRIFDLAIAGYGRKRTTALFIKEGVPSFGRGHHWSASYIGEILTDRRVLGEFQPRRKQDRAPDGPVIVGYYPACIKEEVWLAARAAASQRSRKRRGTARVGGAERREKVQELHAQGKSAAEIAEALNLDRALIYRTLRQLGLQEKPKARPPATLGKQHDGTDGEFVNVFAGLLYDARGSGSYCGSMRFPSHGRGSHKRILIPTASVEGRASCRCFNYDVFEKAVLSCLEELDPGEFINGQDGRDETMILAGERAGIEAELTQAGAYMEKHGFSATIGKRISVLEQRLREVNQQLRAAEDRAAHPLAASWGEFRSLLGFLDKAPDRTDARLRLRGALRRIVDSMHLLVVAKGIIRVCLVQAYFSASHRSESLQSREWLIVHRPPRYNGKNPGKLQEMRWAVSSATEPAPWRKAVGYDSETGHPVGTLGETVPPLDLRRPRDVKEQLHFWEGRTKEQMQRLLTAMEEGCPF
jgi:DNA invertase Pin-like site-specific DNA recombinase